MLEMLLVIAILAIAIVMSRPLFQNPNQDIIESEVCINAISSQLESFFLNATLGKSLSDGQQPDLYVIGLNLIKPA